jgi:photosystem II stability/assembly factor-like uncharacterized protein
MATQKRSLIHSFRCKWTLRDVMLLTFLVTMVGSSGSYALAHNPPIDVNLSGYETFIGIQCTLHGQPATLRGEL